MLKLQGKPVVEKNMSEEWDRVWADAFRLTPTTMEQIQEYQKGLKLDFQHIAFQNGNYLAARLYSMERN